MLSTSNVQQIAAIAQTFCAGYQAADLNGDGWVDALDLVLAITNSY